MGRRVSAGLANVALSMLASAPTLVAVGFALRAGVTQDADDVSLAIVLYAVGACTSILFGILQWGLLAHGGTLGHRCSEVRLVVADTGADPGWGRAFVYQLLLSLTSVLTLGLGLLVTLAVGAQDPERRLWLDRASGLRAVARRPRGNGLLVTSCCALAAISSAVAVAAPPLVADASGGESSAVASDPSATDSDGAVDPGSVTGGDSGDPMELDVALPYANLPCTGEYVLLLESSGDPSEYETTINRAANTSGARYLRTDQSCAGFFQEIDGNAIYAAYVGTFADFSSACAARAQEGGGTVVGLWADRSTNRPLCLCLESADSLPYLSTGDSDPTSDGQDRVEDLQTMLARLSYDNGDPLGSFGDGTESAVARYQENNDLFVDGVVDAATWASMLAEEPSCGGA